jgi:hypothetical protein
MTDGLQHDGIVAKGGWADAKRMPQTCESGPRRLRIRRPPEIEPSLLLGVPGAVADLRWKLPEATGMVECPVSNEKSSLWFDIALNVTATASSR